MKAITAESLEKPSESQTCSTSPPVGGQKTSKSSEHAPLPHQAENQQRTFTPEGIFYLASKGQFIVDVGKRFRVYGRKKPVLTGLRRHLEDEVGTPEEAKERANYIIDCIEIDRAVDWMGIIAGFPRGLHKDRKGQALLIMEGPDIPSAVAGECPTFDDIFGQAFTNPTAKTTFLGWLKGGVEAIRANVHQPAPMMVLAGSVNAGKSLFAWIAQQVLGGRTANPSTAWTGALPWNDDLAAAELLLVDDNRASTDIRDRRNFGAKFKEFIYSPEVSINKRNNTSVSLRPVSRVLVCCNETAENLSVIPPLESDLEDKIALIHFQKITLPIDTSTPEGKTELQRRIRAELPAFLHQLEQLEIPESLRDTRAGVRAWKDPMLIASLRELSPEGRLETLLAHGMATDVFHLAPGESKWMAASEVQRALIDSDNRSQALDLLKHDTSCGRYLSRIYADKSLYVTDRRINNGQTQYSLSRPKGGKVGIVCDF